MKSGYPILTYHQKSQVKLKCRLNLDRLFPDKKDREKFDTKWERFICDKCNREIYCRKGNKILYNSEQLIPTKTNNKPPLLLVFGNPASESVKRGMFFSTGQDGKELRFWKSILESAGLLPQSTTNNLSAKELNQRRKKQLWNLEYITPYRLGLCVFISMPSAASGKWGGVAGIQKLLGATAFRKLEEEETQRIIEIAKGFIKRKGAVITFQKNAWEALRFERKPLFRIEKAKDGKLKGTLKGSRQTQIYGVPPTRLIGPCRDNLKKFL